MRRPKPLCIAMKLATYRDGSRDGQLVLVARDLSTAHLTHGITSRLQQVLDDWNFIAPQLQDLYQQLNAGKLRHAFPFEPASCMAPLPRVYQRVEAGPGTAGLHQSSGDNLLGPCEEIPWPGDDLGLVVRPQLAVITGDVLRGISPGQAQDSVRLVMLAHSLWLGRPSVPTTGQDDDIARNQLVSAFSPVAVTPDECGAAWQDGRLQLSLQSSRNGVKQAPVDLAQGMKRSWGQLIARLCSTRPVRAGCIVGAGPVGSPDLTPLQPGDVLRTEVAGPDHLSLFGALDQRVAGGSPRQ
jgi:fumarylacetoacetate (FAA) hydrolase